MKLVGKPSISQIRSRGFTIVELLVVIVVIGILAAITIVAYSGIQNKASDSAVQADLSTIAKKMELYGVDNARYPSSVAELQTLGLKTSKSSYAISSAMKINLGYCTKPDYSGYAVLAMSKSGKRYVLSSPGNVTAYVGAATWDGTSNDSSLICPTVGYTINFTHGYVASDLVTGPWRAWAGGN